MKKLVFPLAGLLLLIASCKKEGFNSNTNATTSTTPVDTLNAISPAGFDFKTTKTVSITVSLASNNNQPIASVPVNFYSNDPTVTDPLLTAMTDATGTLHAQVELPAYMDTVVIDAKYIGLMRNAKAVISNNTVNATIGGPNGFGGSVVASNFSTSADIKNKQFTMHSLNAVNSLAAADNTQYIPMGAWDSSGVPKYLTTPDVISAQLLSYLNTSLPETVDVRTLHPEYLTSSATSDLVITQTADVWVTFVSEGAGYLNTVGYYTYPTNNPPKSASDVTKIYYMFPNASLPGSGGGLIHTIRKAPYFIWEQFLLPKACQEVKADILHCTANTAPLNLNVPLILTLHDVIFLEQSNLLSKASWYQRLGNIYRKLIVSTIAKKAVRIITVSEFQKNIIIEKLGIAADKITVIHNGADERFFEQCSDAQIADVMKKFELVRGYIFFMANTEPRKNTLGVLNAYAELLNNNPSAPRLVMKGLKAEQLQQMLKDLKLERLEQHVDLIGYVDYADLPAIYQGASMLWFPSFSEGFGLPIVEAMAGGMPVITSSVSCMPEIAGDAAILIDPKNPSEIAAAAEMILNNSELAKSLSIAGKKRASLFTWNAATKKRLKFIMM